MVSSRSRHHFFSFLWSQDELKQWIRSALIGPPWLLINSTNNSTKYVQFVSAEGFIESTRKMRSRLNGFLLSMHSVSHAFFENSVNLKTNKQEIMRLQSIVFEFKELRKEMLVTVRVLNTKKVKRVHATRFLSIRCQGSSSKHWREIQWAMLVFFLRPKECRQ